MHCKECGNWNCTKLEDVHSLVAYGIEEDIKGHFHYHDRNYRYQKWKCENGHEFKCYASNKCWCGWDSHHPDKLYHVNKPIDPDKIPKGRKFGNNLVILNPEWMVNLVKK